MTVAFTIQSLFRSKDFAVGRREKSTVSVNSSQFRHRKFIADVPWKSSALWREIRFLDAHFYQIPTSTFSRHLFAAGPEKKYYVLQKILQLKEKYN